MKNSYFKLAAGVLLVASFAFSVQSMRLQAEKEAEWGARLESVLSELHARLDAQVKEPGFHASASALDNRGLEADQALIQQVSDNKRRLGLIHGELRDLRGLIERFGLLADEGFVASADPLYEEVPREDLAKEREVARELRKRDAIAEFQSEPVRPEWAEETRSAVNEMLSEDDAIGISVPELNCRSNSCEMYWAIDEELTNLEKFERDNYILMKMAKLGLGKVLYLDAPSGAEYRAIFSPPPVR